MNALTNLTSLLPTTLLDRFEFLPLDGKTPFKRDWISREFSETDFRTHHNVGIKTGLPSNLLVLDVDNPDTFCTACREKGHSMRPTKTFAVRTGKGYHLYYARPHTEKCRCRAFKREGFDVKADGGCIVAPGSIHPDTGKPYLIENSRDIAPAPQWLAQLVAEPDKRPLLEQFEIAGEPKELIKRGVPKGERSEAQATAIFHLVLAGASDEQILEIFRTYPIGGKAREQGTSWLLDDIARARKKLESPTNFGALLALVDRRVETNSWLSSDRFLIYLSDGVAMTAKKWRRPQSDIVRACLPYGVRYLKGFPQVDELETIRDKLYAKGDTRRRHASTWSFDLRTSQIGKYNCRIGQREKTQCVSLAQNIGLPATVIFQVALMVPLIEFKLLPPHVHNRCGEVLERFVAELKSQAAFAQTLIRDATDPTETRKPFGHLFEGVI